jgi:hypothetical protein
MLLVGAVAIVARFFAMVRPVTVNSAPCNRPPVAFLGAAAILGLVAACAAVGVPHTNDPTEKLNYARLLLRDGRPLPAERLIGESLEIFQSRGDRGGVASAQHAYAWFLAGDHIEPLAGFYRKNGFRNSPANFDSRRQEAVKYFELAATGFAAAGKYADATNAYLDLAVTQSSDGNLGPACRAFSESLKSYYTYLKRDPNPEVRVPKGYISFEDFVITPAAVAGCPETQVGDKHKDPTEGTASDWHDRKLTLAEEVLALAHQSLGANHPATTEARKLLEHALRNARQSRPVASQ